MTQYTLAHRNLPFKWLHNILLCGCFILHLTLLYRWSLNWFSVLHYYKKCRNKSFVYVFVHVYMQVYLLEKIESGITSKMEGQLYFWWILAKCQPKLLLQFIFQSAMWNITYFSAILSVVCFVNLYCPSQSYRVKIVSDCDFHMWFSDWRLFSHVNDPFNFLFLVTLQHDVSIQLLVLLLVYSHFMLSSYTYFLWENLIINFFL